MFEKKTRIHLKKSVNLWVITGTILIKKTELETEGQTDE